MKSLVKPFCFVVLLVFHGASFADEKSDTLRMQEAIKTIFDSNARGKLKHDAMVVLQELEDPRSIDALYKHIDFLSIWGSQTQRTTENSYPATYALILIGNPSIAGAERYLRSNPSVNAEKLWLIGHVVREIFRTTSGDSNDGHYPEANARFLAWLKKNYTDEQLREVSTKMYFPPLKEYLSSVANQSPPSATKAIRASREFDARSDDSSSAFAGGIQNASETLRIAPNAEASSNESTRNDISIGFLWLVGGAGFLVVIVLACRTMRCKSVQ